MKSILLPDSFAIGLLSLGLLAFLFGPLIGPGLIAILAGIAYWLTMIVVRLVHRRRT